MKKNKLSESAKSAVVYTFATLFSRGLAIITVPIFTRMMTTTQIGTVNLYNSWYSLISAFATLSLTSGGFAVAMKEYAGDRDKYQSAVLSLTSIIAIIIASVFLLAPSFWSKILGLPRVLVVLMLVGFLFAPARDFWLARQRYEYKYKLAGTVTIGSALIASILSVGAVLYSNEYGTIDAADARLIANYAVVYGVAAIIWISTFVKGKTFFNIEYWKMSLALSIPLVGYSIAAQILSVSDRTMISQMVGNSAVGVYGTLYTVSSLSLMIWQAIHSSFVPFLFQNIEKKEQNIKNVSFVLMLLYALVAVVLTYMAPEIVRVLATEEYMEAIYIMPPIAAGVFFTAYANIYSDIAVYFKKTKYVMYPAIVAAAANLVLNYIFIKMFGYMAAAYTTLIAYILLAYLQAVWANKVCKENGIGKEKIFSDQKMLVMAIVTVVLCLLGIALYHFTVLRYIVVLGVIVFSIFLAKKYNVKQMMVK